MGSSEDIGEVIDYMFSKFPFANISALGFSLGANLLTKYLGESRENRLKQACCIGNPWDFSHLVKTIPNKLYGLWAKAIYKGWKDKHLEHKDSFNKVEDYDHMLKHADNFMQFDLMYTLHAYKHKSLKHYYEHSSSKNYIHDIQIPTLFINSLDDPISDKDGIPVQKIMQNDNLILLTVSHGGHLGTFESLDPTDQWFTKPLKEFLGFRFN